jgi:hypothetical protein
VAAAVVLVLAGVAAAFVAAAGQAGARELIRTTVGVGTSASAGLTSSVKDDDPADGEDETADAGDDEGDDGDGDAAVGRAGATHATTSGVETSRPGGVSTAAAPTVAANGPPTDSASAQAATQAPPATGSTPVSAAASPPAPTPTQSGSKPSSPSSSGATPRSSGARPAVTRAGPAATLRTAPTALSTNGRESFSSSAGFGTSAISASQLGKHRAHAAGRPATAAVLATGGIRTVSEFLTALTLPWLAPAGHLDLGGRLLPPPLPSVDTGSTSFARMLDGDGTWGLPIVPLLGAGGLIFLLFAWFLVRPAAQLQESSGPLRVIAQNSHGAVALAAGATAVICALVVLLLGVL